MKNRIIILIIPIMFFLISLVTINDYGISWDEPIHFHRGQSYLHLLLTGEDTFPENIDKPRVSYYETNSLNARWFLENGGGHPPINDILSAVFNRVFYQKLNVLGDIQSYHLFDIVASTILIFIVSLFSYQIIGSIGSFVASLTLATYPLFWAESKFNIKDPVESAFFAATIYSFWMSLEKKSWKWLLLSAISSSLALGTKFNILFLPFILAPYIYFRYINEIKKFGVVKTLKSFPLKYWGIFVLSPIIVIIIFVGLWPFLWEDPIGNFLKVVGYYKEIGTGPSDQQRFLLPGNFSGFPLYWILTTTYPFVLLLTATGIIWVFKILKGKKKNYVALLWLLWLIVPIGRVTAPNTSIYGGVRQIMEFIPAMALLSGAGAVFLLEKLRRIKLPNKFAFLVVILPFTLLIFTLFRLHPNQNVYFNSFIGGLKGAQEKQIPYYGNSFGNAYWQALQWLNENAEPGAHLALIQGTALNIPSIMLRGDIVRNNGFWSGIEREGEYLLELTHQNPVKAYPYSWDYVETFLNPVYEVTVDGVAIAKLWKNDLEHTKEKFMRPEKIVLSSEEIVDNELVVSLKKEHELTRLIIKHGLDDSCIPVAGNFLTSLDGNNWTIEVETVPYPQIAEVKTVEETKLTFFFPARTARYIKFVPSSPDSCIYIKPGVVVKALSNE